MFEENNSDCYLSKEPKTRSKYRFHGVTAENVTVKIKNEN